MYFQAVEKPILAATYAQMCYALSTMEVDCSDDPFETVNFRKLLVNRCQQVFEKDNSDLDYIEEKKKEIEHTQEVICNIFLSLCMSIII